MKSLILISVVLMGIAGAAKAVPADAPTVAMAVAPAGGGNSTAEFLCDLSQPAATELLSSNPVPHLVDEIEMCGTCSQDLCRDRNVGAFCKHPLKLYPGSCRPYNAPLCPGGERPRCQCIENSIDED